MVQGFCQNRKTIKKDIYLYLMQWIDDTNYPIELHEPPQRIVSLVPSQTELLYSLEIEQRVLAITKFCIHPNHWKKNKVIIGGTKNINRSKLLELNPDLVIANAEENTKEDVSWCREHFPTYTTDVNDYTSALKMINDIGEITFSREKAQEIINRIETSFTTLKSWKKKKTALYFIWKKPWMVAGSKNYIDDMLTKLGLVNLAPTSRYPEINFDFINQEKPEFILFSSEPFPFKNQDIEEMKKHLNYSPKFLIVDGEMFSWYGSRMEKSPAYFNSLNL